MQVSEVIRKLQAAIADEMKATNTYSEILDCLQEAGIKGDIIDRIKELKADEEQHSGSLLFIVGTLDKTVSENMEKGAQGK